MRFPGLTVIAARLDATLPLLALILLEPALPPVATPVLLMVATAVLLDVQVSVPKVADVPSVKIPLAVNCFVPNTNVLTVAGVMESELSTGAVTVKVELLDEMTFAPTVVEALMLVVPCARLEAMPLLFNVATVALLDAQVTDPETLPLGLLSE